MQAATAPVAPALAGTPGPAPGAPVPLPPLIGSAFLERHGFGPQGQPPAPMAAWKKGTLLFGVVALLGVVAKLLAG